MDRTSVETTEQILLAPYRHICQRPGKQLASQLFDAFDLWLRIPQDKKEVIANATKMLEQSGLLIDDILDDSNLRRGNPAAHKIFGVPQTINCANYIQFLALKELNKLNNAEVTRVYTEQLMNVHKGEGMELHWRDTFTCPTEEEYKEMVKGKTGAQFHFVVQLMQLYSANKSDFGSLVDTLGVYFQIRDDYANLLTEEDSKGYCEDLTESKFSFLVIHAFRTDPTDTTLPNILRQHPTDRDLKKFCVNYMKKLGSFDYTRTVLMDLETQLYKLIDSHGGNHILSEILEKLSQLYRAGHSTFQEDMNNYSCQDKCMIPAERKRQKKIHF